MVSKVEIEGDQERTNFVLQMGWVFRLATLYFLFSSFFILLVTLAHAMFKFFFFKKK
jgi:hypothetical protein